MKKLFWLLALIGIVAIGCSKEEFDNDNKTELPEENEGENEDGIPENIFFALDKESVTISPDGGSVDVVVYSNYKWEISGTSDWCTPSVKTGEAYEDGQKVTFSADLTYDDREATFWFRCAGEKIKFVVSQKLKKVIIPDENNSFNIPADGGIAVISYKTSVECEVIIPEEAKDWITIAPATRGLVSENINLNIAENTTYDPRSAVIKVVANENDELVVEYTINQEQNNAILADENNTFTIPCTGGEVVIKYQTNVNCEVIIPEEAKDWITIVPATRGLDTYNTTFNIAANNSGKQRSSVIKVVSQDNDELCAEYTITQNPRYNLYYTSSDGKIVNPYSTSSFDATILSNTYKEGVGEIEFNAPITSIGREAFKYCSSLTSVAIPDSVTEIGDLAFNGCSSLISVTIPDSVTTIGNSVFRDCSSLTSVTIPNSVTTIGVSAFNLCSSLTNVTIPDSVTEIRDLTFFYCSSLTSITIPNSVTSIGELAFHYCSSLTSVTIPDSVTTIGESAFSGCDGLTSITIPNSVTMIGERAFSGCNGLTSITIPNSVTTIGERAFGGCRSLTSVTIPDSVTEIGYDAFSGCSSLQEFNGKFASEDGRCLIVEGVLNSFISAGLTEYSIPDSVTEIGESAFSYCSDLTSITIPNSVTTIGESAFSYCRGLTSITIPNSVTSIGREAFKYCSSLTSVTIPDSVTTIGVLAFDGCSSLQEFNGKFASEDGRCLIIEGVLNSFISAGLTEYSIPDSVTSIGEMAFRWCDGLTSITIPDSVTSIGIDAFSDCSRLTSVTIPDSVTTIGEGAFYMCQRLTSVTIPDSVTTIGGWAFCECSSLTSVTIGDSVTTIGESAFSYCRGLTSVYCKPIIPPAGDSDMFSGNASGRKIYVPTESVVAYKIATYWGDYASDIVGYDF